MSPGDSEPRQPAATGAPTPGSLAAARLPAPAPAAPTPAALTPVAPAAVTPAPASVDPRVDDALSRLADVEALPLSEQVEVFAEIHRRLAAVLADPDSRA